MKTVCADVKRSSQPSIGRCHKFMSLVFKNCIRSEFFRPKSKAKNKNIKWVSHLKSILRINYQIIASSGIKQQSIMMRGSKVYTLPKT